MQDIELKFHQLLTEISGESFNPEEQSKIVAYATSLFKSKFRKMRFASNLDEKIINGHMNDAILKSMASLNEWESYDEEIIDSSGLSSNQLMRKVAQTNKSKWGMQNIVNPELIEELDLDSDKIDSYEEHLDNAQQTNEALITPGHGKHRTDFQSQPIR